MELLNIEKSLKSTKERGASLPLLRGLYLCNHDVLGIGSKKASQLTNGIISRTIFNKSYNKMSSSWGGKKVSREMKAKRIQDRDSRKKAVAIRENVTYDLKRLDELIENASNDVEKSMLMCLSAQLTQKIDLKQKALSNEINNHLFKVLEIVGNRLDDSISTAELKEVLTILRDCSAIVGLIGKTPLIAQQFNHIDSKERSENQKIQAIEVEILDNEVKS